jgi:hypothetical protein
MNAAKGFSELLDVGGSLRDALGDSAEMLDSLAELIPMINGTSIKELISNFAPIKPKAFNLLAQGLRIAVNLYKKYFVNTNTRLINRILEFADLMDTDFNIHGLFNFFEPRLDQVLIYLINAVKAYDENKTFTQVIHCVDPTFWDLEHSLINASQSTTLSLKSFQGVFHYQGRRLQDDATFNIQTVVPVDNVASSINAVSVEAKSGNVTLLKLETASGINLTVVRRAANSTANTIESPNTIQSISTSIGINPKVVVETATKIHNDEKVGKTQTEPSNFPGWAIALIVVGSVLIIGGIVVVILLFGRKKDSSSNDKIANP